MEIVALVVNIAFIVLLIVALVLGFIKGLWRKLYSLVGLFIGLILIFIFLNPVSNALANTNIGFLNGSLTDFIIDIVQDELYEGKVISPDSATYTLCLGLAKTAGKLVILLGGMLITLLVITPICSLVLRLIFKKKEPEKKLFTRLGGMGVAFAHFFVAAFLLLLPVFGLINIASDYQEVLNEEPELVSAVEKLNASVPSYMYKLFGQDTASNALGAVTKVKTEDGYLNIFSDIKHAGPVISVLATANENTSILDLIKENQEEFVTFLTETDSLEVIYPATIEYLKETDALEGLISVETLEQLTFDVTNEELSSTIDAVIEFVENSSFDTEDPMTILKDEKLAENLQTLGDKLSESPYLKFILYLLQDVINGVKESSGDLGKFLGIINLTEIEKEDLSSDLYNFGKIVEDVNELGVLEGEANALEHPDAVENLINDTLNLSQVKGHESEVVKMLLEVSGLLEEFEKAGITLNFENVDWEQEKVTLGLIIKEVATLEEKIPNFEFGNLGVYLQDDTYNQDVRNLIKTLTKSQLIDFTFFVDILEKELQASGMIVSIDRNNLPVGEEWIKELDCIFEIVKYAESLGTMLDDMGTYTKELGIVFENIFASKIFNSIGYRLINEMFLSMHIKQDAKDLDISKVVSWEQEVNALDTLTKKVETIDLKNITKENIKDLIVSATGTDDVPTYMASFIVGSLVNDYIKEVLTSEAYAEFIKTHKLTDPAVLKASVDDIVIALELSKVVSEETDFTNLSKEEIKDICDTYASIDLTNNEVVKTVIDEIIKAEELDITEEDLENVDFEKEAEHLEAIMTAVSNNASSTVIDALIEQAKEDTVLLAELAEKYLR
ncbi:MAG: CvpA family protein [Bacilli bacterium]|nr:CvpA family protein [Bacilli bacterium]